MIQTTNVIDLFWIRGWLWSTGFFTRFSFQFSFDGDCFDNVSYSRYDGWPYHFSAMTMISFDLSVPFLIFILSKKMGEMHTLLSPTAFSFKTLICWSFSVLSQTPLVLTPSEKSSPTCFGSICLIVHLGGGRISDVPEDKMILFIHQFSSSKVLVLLYSGIRISKTKCLDLLPLQIYAL